MPIRHFTVAGICTARFTIRRCENGGKEYVSLSLAAREFGLRQLYANLDRACTRRRFSRVCQLKRPAD